MADVAARCGVSIKTVSRVVNGEAGVSTKTALRIQQMIVDLGFQRHEGASLLRSSGRSETVGLIVEDLANPFYSQLAAGIEREVRLRQHLLVSASSERSSADESQLIEALLARRVTGLIIVPIGAEPTDALRAACLEVPVVCLDRPVSGLDADAVLSDNEGGMRSAVEHLAAHRHERLAFLGDDASIWTAQRRAAAFREAVASLGLPGPIHCELGPWTDSSLADRLVGWTRGRLPVTALVTGNNRVTLSALRAMQDRDLDLGLVGYDDFDLSDVVSPPVTVVHQDPVGLGERAAQQVFSRLSSGRATPMTVVVPTRLVVRGSGRPIAPKGLRAQATH